MDIVIQGQRDPRWASKVLGYNTGAPYTLGNYGCLLTCFSMYLTAIGKPETPDTVNDKCKANNGFVQGGNLVWSVPEKIWGIKLVYQSPYYDGPVTSQGKAKMKALLDERRPLICHVDFDPNDPDDDMHWILVTKYVGDTFHCNDPWSGKNVPVDVYGGSIERAVLEFRAYDPIVPETATVQTCDDLLTEVREQRDENHNDRMACFEELGFTGSFNRTIAVEEIRKLKALEKSYNQKDEKIGELTMQIQVLEKKISDQQTALETAQSQLEETVTANLGMQKTVQSLTSNNTTLQKAVQDLKDSIKIPTFRGFKKTLYDWLMKG